MQLLESGMNWVGDKLGEGAMWLGGKLGEGAMWLGGKGLDGVFWSIGEGSRFMVEYCSGAFLVFALVGGLVYIGGGEKTGMKMIRISLVSYLAMGFIGVVI